MVDRITNRQAKSQAAPHDAYPVRTVAQMTGLSPDIIRAWEKRYDVVRPMRGPRGARLYSASDVARLHALARAVASGRSIGDVAHLNSTELQSLPLGTEVRNESIAPSGSEPVVAALLNSVRRSDVVAIEQQLADALVAHGSNTFLSSVVAPLLYEVGEGWVRGEISVAQEHLVSACLRNLLAGMLRNRRGADHQTLLLATSPGERHEFGLLLIALAARDVGVGVRYLGVDLPADEIAAAAISGQCRAVGIGAVSDEHRLHAVATIQALERSLPPTMELWLGGRDALQVAAQAGATRTRILTDLLSVQHELQRLRAMTAPFPTRPTRA